MLHFAGMGTVMGVFFKARNRIEKLVIPLLPLPPQALDRLDNQNKH